MDLFIVSSPIPLSQIVDVRLFSLNKQANIKHNLHIADNPSSIFPPNAAPPLKMKYFNCFSSSSSDGSDGMFV